MSSETWKDIEGYNGYYQVSSVGRVKSFNSPNKQISEFIMKQNINRYGYMTIKFEVNGKRVSFLVHRLVANAFIPKIENKEIVNHLNGNKQDNRIENLEWTTTAGNNQHAYDTNLRSQKKGSDSNCSGAKTSCSIEIIQLSKEGVFIRTYASIGEAERETGINHISPCCNGKRKTAGGFKWMKNIL